MCSSIDSERMASDEANIVTKKRTRLKSDRLEMMLIIKKHLKRHPSYFNELKI